MGVLTTPTPQAPQLVTALPTNPVDGQEVYFVADAANSIVWHLRYRAATPGSYKWEYVGGPPIYDKDEFVGGEQALIVDNAGGTWRSYANTPTVTTPLAGDWMVDLTQQTYLNISTSAYIWYEVQTRLTWNGTRDDTAGNVLDSTFEMDTVDADYLSPSPTSHARWRADGRPAGVVAVTIDSADYGSTATTDIKLYYQKLALTPVRLG